MRYDICTVVISDLTFDARVWKEVRSLATAGYRVKLIGCLYDIDTIRRRREGPIDVVEIPLGSRASVSRRGRAGTLLRVWRETLRTPAVAYHCHNIHPGLAAYIAARRHRARLIYDGHELYGSVQRGAALSQRAIARVAFLMERFMFLRSHASITTNLSRREVLRRRHGEVDPIVLANVPPRVEHVTPLDPGYPVGKTILLYQGGIYARQRAFRETLEALTQLPELHFVVLGFGRDEDLRLIDRWAEELGIADRVHRLPARPPEELVRTAAAATIGIVPIKPMSLNHVLGDTNKLHEYLMAGLPVVGSDLPEIRRVITEADPPLGELFDPSSATSIAAAVRRLLDDPAGLDPRRREARRQAMTRHNWEIEEARLLGMYAAIIGPPSRADASTATSS